MNTRTLNQNQPNPTLSPHLQHFFMKGELFKKADSTSLIPNLVQTKSYYASKGEQNCKTKEKPKHSPQVHKEPTTKGKHFKKCLQISDFREAFWDYLCFSFHGISWILFLGLCLQYGWSSGVAKLQNTCMLLKLPPAVYAPCTCPISKIELPLMASN